MNQREIQIKTDEARRIGMLFETCDQMKIDRKGIEQLQRLYPERYACLSSYTPINER